MKRLLVWGLPLLFLAVLALAIGRLVVERRDAQTAAAAPKAAPVLALGSADIATAALQELERAIEVSGSVRAVRSAFVKTRVAGEITRIAVREGEAVREGQVLVQQETNEYDWRVRQAEEQARGAKSQLDIAQRTLANNRALVAQGFISPTALETSIANEAAAQANLQAAQAAVELARKARGDTTLTAPLTGLVAQRLAQPGERVGVDVRILEIVDLSQLEVEAALAAADVAALRIGSPARLAVDGLTEPVTARVARINPSAQAGSRTVPVYLALDAHPALRQGLFARGRVVLERQQVVALPASAVRLDRADPYVLVVEGERIQSRRVRTGLRGQAAGVDVVQIVEGLAAGERVLAGSLGAVADGTAWRAAAAAAVPASAASTASNASAASAAASAPSAGR